MFYTLVTHVEWVNGYRFFDIAKPFFIKKMEKFPGGWGIMLDDVLAGVYANILLQAALFYKLF